eukprot:Platyproteum_vivax@DN5254_c0_g1_i3.p1
MIEEDTTIVICNNSEGVIYSRNKLSQVSPFFLAMFSKNFKETTSLFVKMQACTSLHFKQFTSIADSYLTNGLVPKITDWVNLLEVVKICDFLLADEILNFLRNVHLTVHPLDFNDVSHPNLTQV